MTRAGPKENGGSRRKGTNKIGEDGGQIRSLERQDSAAFNGHMRCVRVSKMLRGGGERIEGWEDEDTGKGTRGLDWHNGGDGRRKKKRNRIICMYDQTDKGGKRDQERRECDKVVSRLALFWLARNAKKTQGEEAIVG